MHKLFVVNHLYEWLWRSIRELTIAVTISHRLLPVSRSGYNNIPITSQTRATRDVRPDLWPKVFYRKFQKGVG